MSINQDLFEDSLIDWTGPIVDLNLSRPLIPLPVFTSSQSDIDGDNPFDALERQVNDEILDLWNTSASLLDRAQNSPIRNKGQDSVLGSYAILIQLDDDDLNGPDVEVDRRNVVDSQIQKSSTSVTKEGDIGDLVVSRVSTCSDQALNNAFRVSQTFPHSLLWSSDDGSTAPFRNSKSDNWLDECSSESNYSSRRSSTKKGERSRSMESLKSLWNTYTDVTEDLMSITMPTWCDELSSSSDEEYDAYKLSLSLPLKLNQPSSGKIRGQILKMNTNDGTHTSLSTRGTRTEKTLLKSTLMNAAFPIVNPRKRPGQEKLPVSDKFENRSSSTSATKIKSKRISISKQKNIPLATSTPHCRKDIPVEQETTKTPNVRSRISLGQREIGPRAPSPDSTSSPPSSHPYKITSKNRVTKLMGKKRRNSFSNPQVSSSQTSPSSKLFNKTSMRQKGNRL